MASILLLESHPNQRLLYQMELEDAGHHVEVLDHLDEALDQVSSDPPDLVVVDPCLAMSQGMWALTAIKEMAPDLPLIIYTAESLFGDDYCYFLADACLTKRSDTTELLHTIDELLTLSNV